MMCCNLHCMVTSLTCSF